MKFEMKILNIFYLSDERVIFIGSILNHPKLKTGQLKLIGACCCNLYYNDMLIQQVDCEGERMIQRQPNSLTDSYAISTKPGAQISLTSEEVQAGGWKLICND